MKFERKELLENEINKLLNDFSTKEIVEMVLKVGDKNELN